MIFEKNLIVQILRTCRYISTEIKLIVSIIVFTLPKIKNYTVEDYFSL